MGGNSSKEEGNWRQNSSSRSTSWDSHFGYSQTPYGYGQESQIYAPQQPYPAQQYYPPSQEYSSSQPSNNRKKLERKYSRIADNYNSLDQVRVLYLDQI